MTCDVCGRPTTSKSGVCQKTAACKRERVRRWRANPGAMRQWVPCDVCGNRCASAEGVCRRTAECRRERQRRQRTINHDAELERRRRYYARTDRPCRYAHAGCAEYSIVNGNTCREHSAADSKRYQARLRVGLVDALARRQGWLCTFCKAALPPDLAQVHVDHTIPRAIIVIEDEWNLQALHELCNLIKGERLTPEAIALADVRGISLPSGHGYGHPDMPDPEPDFDQDGAPF